MCVMDNLLARSGEDDPVSRSAAEGTHRFRADLPTGRILVKASVSREPQAGSISVVGVFIAPTKTRQTTACQGKSSGLSPVLVDFSAVKQCLIKSN